MQAGLGGGPTAGCDAAAQRRQRPARTGLRGQPRALGRLEAVASRCRRDLGGEVAVSDHAPEAPAAGALGEEI
jgi:hypothetical protein